jgi:hypothetical protein
LVIKQLSSLNAAWAVNEERFEREIEELDEEGDPALVSESTVDEEDDERPSKMPCGRNSPKITLPASGAP